MSTRYSAAEAISFSMSGGLEGGEDQPTANRGQAPLSNRTEKPGRSILAGAPVVNSACRLSGEVSDLSRRCPVPIDQLLAGQETRTMSKTVQIANETAEIIQRTVDQGLFPDPETAFAEAVRLLDELEDDHELRARLQVVLDEFARGKAIPWNEETKQHILREGREAHERGDLPDPDVCP